MAYLATIRKALAAAILAAAAVIVAAQQSKGALDESDWIGAVVAGLVAGAGVFLIPNKPA